jgi:hypothetical protein
MNRQDAYRIGKAVSCGDLSGETEFEVEEALYWWCADHHSGQWSEEYSILSSSPFRPGPLSNGPEPDSYAAMIYDAMCDESACTHESVS